MAVCAGALCPALVSDVRAGTASAAAAGMRADLTSASCSSDLSSSSAFLPRRFCWQLFAGTSGRRRARSRKNGPFAFQSRASMGSGVAQRPYTALMIVPTGTGASIGGFAGDALPVARAMASVADCVITHPNVLNGAMLYWPIPNALYVEGYALDQFAEGAWGLQPVHQNRIGLVLDVGIEEELRLRHLQVADATCATLGLPILEYTITDTPLQVEKWLDEESGASTGRLGRPDSLMRAVRHLVENCGVDAVAVVARFPDDSCEELVDYRQGQGVDVLAGVEAIISHMVVKEFRIPCAHAPALAPLPFDHTISPRSAAEEIGFTFLPCVLAGLSRAPQYVTKVEHLTQSRNGTLWTADVDSVVVPVNACGGDGTLAFARKVGRKPLIIAVEENETVLNDTPESLGIEAVRVANYWEALGVMAAHKAGVHPKSLRRDGVVHLRRSYDFTKTPLESSVSYDESLLVPVGVQS
ncbi:hypothetical protein MPTK1_4g14060 [Marchantia polymorpha subsp. ruderalis]|uniref:DUF3326 domain-containing protein n=4 Tax=Marchantia polymorpha TaxID=3197 RepID=A0A176VFC9_MARPO|nr:hypothetical protein AXG93_1860s1060 [Marchantia polymorpha subsp. ruderalis]PTQ35613.1 hypothetical protein MARPO_0070s0076 [Marchantia polymorpha]BBN08740.1 hypothetical protein Mp_4g14060 [Marchantia polymorpha subsp. ruderalis]|eukprot:PTQ35613.1 hypothetical protein MARPO_0070s0076 [Marchantia polymorpha]